MSKTNLNAKIVDFPIEAYPKNKMHKKARDINNIYSFTPFQKHKQNPILKQTFQKQFECRNDKFSI